MSTTARPKTASASSASSARFATRHALRKARSLALVRACCLVLLGASAPACGGAQGPEPQASTTTPGEKRNGPAQADERPSEVPSNVQTSAVPPATAPGPWPFGPPTTEAEQAAELARLTENPGPLKTNWVPPGKSERYGHAEALIAAPHDVVRTRLADFAHYKDLAGPKFKKVSVVDKHAGLTDVYFQLPIMKGLVTLWYVTRFSPPRAVSGVGDVIEGTFVKGSIKGMHIAFTMRPGSAPTHTVVTCDLLLALAIPAPQSNVDEELRDACGDALNAVRAKTTQPAP